jgi:hypothetical protein
MFQIVALFGLAATALGQIDTSQDCSQEPDGFGPIPSPNTDTEFVN